MTRPPRRRSLRAPALAIAAVGWAGCGRPAAAERPPEPTARPRPASAARGSVLIDDVPFVRQKPDFCGEACVEMAAHRLGKRYDQDAVFAASGVDPALGRGAYTAELVRAVERLGFRPGPVWSTVDARDPARGIDAALGALHADLARGVPSIVCMHYSDAPETTEHFRLIVGYDAERDQLVYQEPAEDDGAYRRMDRALFAKLWPLHYSDDAWTLIRIPLEPGRLAEPAADGGAFRPAAYAQHVMQLRERLRAERLGDLPIRIEAPFVVTGNGSPAELAERASTVRWAADHLEQDFFARRPSRILDVFLFDGARRYQQGVRALTGEAPTTPYGFYSSAGDALLMNIATGGGTLVHEIVHPYVEADFPDAPPWLNEGLGSLFEQSAERDGHIVGLTNWRLAGLQRAIAADRVPRFRDLTAMDETAFYADDDGTHYAASRYLLYYLQQRGLLRDFYRAFRAGHAADPTGYATLAATLGERDMEAFQRRWERYVAGLRFP